MSRGAEMSRSRPPRPPSTARVAFAGAAIATFLGALVAAAPGATIRVAADEAPTVRGSRVQVRALAGDGLPAAIDGLLADPGPRWVGWSAPLVAGARSICCTFDGRCGHCRLEGRDRGISIRDDRDEEAGAGAGKTADDGEWLHLEGGGTASRSLVVLLRLEDGRIDRVRAVTRDCRLDAGGLPFVWLPDVPATVSVAYLASLMEDGEGGSSAGRSMPGTTVGERAAKGALVALAHHRGEGAVDSLVRMAREDPGADLRGQALFWLSQRAGRVAAAAIDDAVREDPEYEVKERAVFALSQLPADEGVPLLIRVARTHRSPRLRKRAIFWLGQSGDPRALDFFREVLEGAGEEE